VGRGVDVGPVDTGGMVGPGGPLGGSTGLHITLDDLVDLLAFDVFSG
jgi:hypothetical protein